MTIKSNLNLSKTGVTYIPNACSYSKSCDSKMNGMRKESKKWPGRITQGQEDPKNGTGRVKE